MLFAKVVFEWPNCKTTTKGVLYSSSSGFKMQNCAFKIRCVYMEHCIPITIILKVQSE